MTTPDDPSPRSTPTAAPLLPQVLALALPAGLLAWLTVGISFLPSLERMALDTLSGPDSLRFLRLVAGVAGLALVVVFFLRHRVIRLAGRLSEDYARVIAAAPIASPPYVGHRAYPLLLWTLAAGCLFAVIQACVTPDAYAVLIAEDGVVEYGTAICFAAAALTTFVGLLRLRRGATAARLVYALMTLFLVVCTGEEISWGQRIFGFASPESLATLNKQGEANLHDIGSISVFSNAFFVLTLVAFLLVPRLLRRTPDLRIWLRHHDLPRVHPRLARIFLVGLIAWIIIGVRFGTLGFHPFSLWGYYTQMDDEIFEFVAAYSFFAFAVLDLVSRRRTPSLANASAPRT